MYTRLHVCLSYGAEFSQLFLVHLSEVHDGVLPSLVLFGAEILALLTEKRGGAE